MVDIQAVYALPLQLEGRMRGYGLGTNLELVNSRPSTAEEARQNVRLWNAVFSFKGIVTPRTQQVEKLEITYMPGVSFDQRPTFGRVSQLLAYGREAREVMRVSMTALRASHQILSKGRIAGYDGLSRAQRENRTNLNIGEELQVLHSVRDAGAEPDAFFNAAYILGIRPLLMVSR